MGRKIILLFAFLLPAYFSFAQLSGNITVGTSGANYTSLTKAGGLFEAINNQGLGGNTTVTITSNLTEDGSVSLTYTNPNGYLLTITGASSTNYVISGTSIQYKGILVFSTTNHVTLIKPAAGTLTVINNNSNENCIEIFDSNDITIDGLIVKGSANADIYLKVGDALLYPLAAKNIIIQNCQITAASPVNLIKYGISLNRYFPAGSLPLNANNKILAQNNVISEFTSIGIFGSILPNVVAANNEILEQSNRSTSLVGIRMDEIGNLIIEGNIVRDLVTTGASSEGMEISGAANQDFYTSIKGNKIYDLDAASHVFGIQLYPSSSSTPVTDVVNNMISISPPSVNSSSYGIYDLGNAGDTRNFYYNSVYVGGANSFGGNDSYAFGRTNATNIKLYNNIFFNGRTGGTNTVHGTIDAGNSVTGLDASNNMYMGQNTGPATTSFFKLPAGPTAFGGWINIVTDKYSNSFMGLTAASIFNNAIIGDLSIKNSSSTSWIINGKGKPISSIPDDYNATNVRSVSVNSGSTDIGADEFTPSTAQSAVYGTLTGSTAIGNTQDILYSNLKIGSIKWLSATIFPAIGNIYYYSGTEPNDLSNGTANPANPHHMNGYIQIDALGGSNYTYELTLNYDPSMLGSIMDPTTMRINKKQVGTNGTWTSAPTTIDPVNKTAKATFNSFSEFTLTDATATLPISFKDFYADLHNNDVNIKCTILNCEKNTSYTVERSADGVNFVAVGSGIIGDLNNDLLDIYFTDKNVYMLNATSLYYRIKYQEVSGNVMYSKTTAIKLSENKSFSVTVTPNPFKELRLNIYMPQAGKLDMMITDMSGKKLYNSVKQISTGYTIFLVDELKRLPRGCYLLSVHTAKDRFSKTIIKE